LLLRSRCPAHAACSGRFQENRRHARLRKKASKLDVADLLEIAALKGMPAPAAAGQPAGGDGVALHPPAESDDAVASPASAPEPVVALPACAADADLRADADHAADEDEAAEDPVLTDAEPDQ